MSQPESWFGRFFVGGSKYSEENEHKNYNKIYGTYLYNLLATLVMVRVLLISTNQHAFAFHGTFNVKNP